MNENNLYSKLVDLYADRTLTEELEATMDAASTLDPQLNWEMRTLRKTVDLLHAEEAAEFTEESHQRILLKMYSRGVQLQTQSPDPIHLQYQLPIQG